MEMTKATAKTAPITGTRAVKPADTRGPKAGSAQSNQTAKLSAPAKKSDVISSVKGMTSGGDHTAVSAPGHDTLLIKRAEFVGAVAKAAVIGGSLKAVTDALTKLRADKPAAVMAKGVDSHNSPQTAKAVADAKRSAPKADPVSAALAKAGKVQGKPAAGKTAPKAEAKAAKTPSTGGIDRKYKATKKEDVSKPDTFRNYMISTIRAHTQTSAAKAAHAASGKFGHERLNFKWAHDNGYIVLADLA